MHCTGELSADSVGSLLTGQLSSDSLERQLPELFDQRSQLGAADQLVFAVVQLVHGHEAIGQNPLHQHSMPATRGGGRGGRGMGKNTVVTMSEQSEPMSVQRNQGLTHLLSTLAAYT